MSATTYDIIQYSGQTVGHTVGKIITPGNTPRWNGAGRPAQPIADISWGYDVRAAQNHPNIREAAYSRANGHLAYVNSNNDIEWWPLFINDISQDLSISGQTAQSRLTRDFYARSFVQPSFVVEGQSLDQLDYGYLTEYVHHVQYDAMSNTGSPLVQLWVAGRGIQSTQSSNRGVSLNSKTISPNQQFWPNQSLRGPHSEYLCQGYINAIVRKHSKGVYAPTYTFNFVVSALIKGPYSEDVIQITQQQSWVDVLNGTSNLTTSQSLLKENNSVLQYAQNNSVNVLSGNTG